MLKQGFEPPSNCNSKKGMGDNNAGSSAMMERNDAIQELEEAKARYLACEPLYLKVKDFLKKNHGVILEEQENQVKKGYSQLYPKLQQFKRMKENYSEEDSFCAPFNSLIIDFERTCPVSDVLLVKKEELLDLASEICHRLGGIELRLSSVIGVLPRMVLIEIFEKLLAAFSTLQDVLAEVLKTFRGENDGSMVPTKMTDWAGMTGKIILFLTEVLLKLPGFEIDVDQLQKVNQLLNRVGSLYKPELFFGFVKVVGTPEAMIKYKDDIENHQCEIGHLVDEIREIAGY